MPGIARIQQLQEDFNQSRNGNPNRPMAPSKEIYL